MTAAERAVELHRAGLEPKAIAEQLHVQLEHVMRALRAAGRVGTKRPKSGGSMHGNNLGDPKRADRRLRRFSWEDAA